MSKIALSILVAVILLFPGAVLSLFAYCDFNNDGFDDLAIGDSGAVRVRVLYGKPDGLSGTNVQVWSPNSFPMGIGEEPTNFGTALACGDFNGDGKDDLAIGASYAGINTIEHAGGVFILYAA